jgi:exonuclease III
MVYKADIVALLDTRIGSSVEDRICSLYDVRIYSSRPVQRPGHHPSRGTSIMVSRRLEFKPLDMVRDANGNLLSIKAKINSSLIAITAVYAPNRDCIERNQFYERVFDVTCQWGLSNMVICGDFNCALNFELETKNYSTENEANRLGREKLLALLDLYDFYDPLRELRPGEKIWTWKAGLDQFNTINSTANLTNEKRARLDYVFISSGTRNFFITADIG